jgi:hypothetical protein
MSNSSVITPQQIRALRAVSPPPPVWEYLNQMLVQNFNGHSATINHELWVESIRKTLISLPKYGHYDENWIPAALKKSEEHWTVTRHYPEPREYVDTMYTFESK